jgi:hypothetical protein
MKLAVKPDIPINGNFLFNINYKDFNNQNSSKKKFPFAIHMEGVNDDYIWTSRIIVWVCVLSSSVILLYLGWSWMEVFLFNRLGILTDSKH